MSYAPAGKVVFLKLHDNETTAELAAVEIIKSKGGKLITVENDEKRTLKFNDDGNNYEFDPNRMFSKTGITLTLKRFGSYHSSIVPVIEKFSENIISKISTYPYVIAVHNNTNDNYSLLDYKAGDLKRDALAVYQNPEQDIDDFVFTTDKSLFDYLQAQKVNVVLQNNRSVTNDGSLSYYYGKTKKFYVNVEAQVGHKEEQVMMIGKVLEFLNRM